MMIEGDDSDVIQALVRKYGAAEVAETAREWAQRIGEDSAWRQSRAAEPPKFTSAEVPAPKRIKSVDGHGNIAYIHKTARGWCCTLANGTPASMFYAVGTVDEMALKFALDDAKTDAERLEIVRKSAGAWHTVSLV